MTTENVEAKECGVCTSLEQVEAEHAEILKRICGFILDQKVDGLIFATVIAQTKGPYSGLGFVTNAENDVEAARLFIGSLGSIDLESVKTATEIESKLAEEHIERYEASKKDAEATP